MIFIDSFELLFWHAFFRRESFIDILFQAMARAESMVQSFNIFQSLGVLVAPVNGLIIDFGKNYTRSINYFARDMI